MRISICGRDSLSIEALGSLLNHEGRFDIVAVAESPMACLTESKQRHAQVIVLDGTTLNMNDLDFFMGARAYGDFGIVLVRPSLKPDEFENNIDAFVAPQEGSTALFNTIRKVGAKFASSQPPAVKEKRTNYRNGFELTSREYDVAMLVAKGYSNRRIADEMKLREQSIKNLVSVVLRKLKCDNRVQVALKLSSARFEAQSG